MTISRLSPRGIQPGTEGQVLTTKSGNAAWAAAPSGSGNVPAGGTSGQVLTKLSATDYDTGWQTPSGGGGGGAAMSAVWHTSGNASSGKIAYTPDPSVQVGDVAVLIGLSTNATELSYTFDSSWIVVRDATGDNTGYYGNRTVIAMQRVTSVAAVSVPVTGTLTNSAWGVIYLRGPQALPLLSKSNSAQGNSILPGVFANNTHGQLVILSGTCIPGLATLPAFPSGYSGAFQQNYGYCTFEAGFAAQDIGQATLTTANFDHVVYTLNLA